MTSIYSNNNPLDNKILDICNNEYSVFLSKCNVIGVGLGYKIINYFNTLEKCITVFVTKKISKNNLNPKCIIPTLYRGIKTDIIEIGTMNPCSLTGRIRPVPGGYSISPSPINGAATLGCIVTDGSYYYLLGCNHVFTYYQSLSLGTSITQPGIADGGIVSKDTIANLSKYIKLNPKTSSKLPENYVDCAIAKVLATKLVDPKIAFVGKIMGNSIPQLGEVLFKVGRTTDLTTGTVTHVGVSIVMPYRNVDIFFKDQFITTSMGSGGDSGSIVLDTAHQAVGLLASTSSTHTLYNPMELVLTNLDVEIVI